MHKFVHELLELIIKETTFDVEGEGDEGENISTGELVILA
jgi:hypothetical protein